MEKETINQDKKDRHLTRTEEYERIYPILQNNSIKKKKTHRKMCFLYSNR